MSTTYFYKPPPCPCCGHTEEIEIGLSAAGWAFALNVYPSKGLVSLGTWLQYMRNNKGTVRDEYNKQVPLHDLRNIIADRVPRDHPHTNEFLQVNSAVMHPFYNLAALNGEQEDFVGYGRGSYYLISQERPLLGVD